MKKQRLYKKLLTLAVGGALLGAGALGVSWKNSARAQEEIPEGTPLNKGNLDQLLGKKLDGHNMRDLLSKDLESFIRDHGWSWVRLLKSYENDPKKTPIKKGLLEGTNLFKGQAKLNPTTKVVENFTAGIPFTDISLDDPMAGYKIMNNSQKGPWLTDSAFGLIDGLLIDSKSGPQKQIGFTAGIFRYKGRQHKPWNIEGVDKNMVFMVFQKYPTDAKGVGMMMLLYPDGRLPDIYAYVRMIRRTRRLGGGAWGDPLAGTDFNFDEVLGGLIADPSWYQNVKLLGKRYTIANLHGEMELPPGFPFPGMVSTRSDMKGRFPQIDIQGPPYWTLKQVGEPVSVYEVEITPPKGFSWSKRIAYYGTHPYLPANYWSFIYDKKGKLWKILNNGFFFVEDAEKEYGVAPHFIAAYDIQRGHATLLQPDVPRWQPVWNQAGTSLAKQFTPENVANLVE